jgi:hypothetical protein
MPLFNEGNVDIEVTDCRSVTLREISDLLGWKPLYAHIRWISDHRVEATAAQDIGELGLPVEGVDAVAFFVVEHLELAVGVEVRSDQAVAAFDVVPQVGQGAFVEEAQLVVK